MATFVRSERVIAALGSLGIGETENVERVVIDLRAGNVPVIHIRRHGDARLLELVEALTDGPRIEWVEQSGIVRPRAAETRDEPDQTTFSTPQTHVRPELDPPSVDIRPDPWLRADRP